MVGGGRPSVDSLMDSLSARDVTLEDLSVLPVLMEGWLFCAGAPSPTRPDCGYGLLFCDWCFFAPFRFELCRLPSPEDAALRFANFFIKAEKGRRRPVRVDRSTIVSVLSKGLSGGAELRLLRRKVEEKGGMVVPLEQ